MVVLPLLTKKLPANFMYNQRIEGTDAATPTWTYSPIKYWPNEIQEGDVDQQVSDPAQGSNSYGGKLSFFAYAPYVETVGTEGVTAFTSTNASKGDPVIAYKVPNTANSVVDLLWGTMGTTGSAIISGGNAGVTGITDASGGTYQEALLTGYKTNADLTKQEIDGKVDFAFKHALAKFGGYEGLKIIADVDEEKGTANLAANTKITVKSITIKTRARNSADTKYYADQAGTLNLATGVWNITSSEQDAVAELATYEITNEMLNSDIKDKDGDTYANQPVGVSGSAEKDVYADADTETNPVVFIPGTRPQLVVTVDYVVRTEDAKLNGGCSVVPQKITRTITFGSTVELNKYYKLVIRLGMTSVKFNASVSSWDDGTGGGAATEVNLPLNVQ